MVIIGHKNSPDTGFKQSDFKQKMGSTKPVPFNRKSIEKKSNIIKTRLFSEKKNQTVPVKKVEGYSLIDFAEQVGSNKLFNRSKLCLENKNSFVSNVKDNNGKKINPKISNPNNISGNKSSLDQCINQVFKSLSDLKGSPLPLKKKDNVSNPSTFILKNLTSVSNSIYSESQPESMQNNTLFEVNKILTLGKNINISHNLNHRVPKIRNGSTLIKENSHSVIKDIFQDDLSFITGKNSINNKDETIVSKQKGLSSKLSGNSEIISRILKNFPIDHYVEQGDKSSSQFDCKVKTTSEELKQKLDHLREIGESFVDVKNISKYRKTLIDLHHHLKKSSIENQMEVEGIKLDTGSREIGSEEDQIQSIARFLSTQTGNQIRDKQERYGNILLI